jgi:3-oxo-5-alpha-steroid 4-dehydrogenase 1
MTQTTGSVILSLFEQTMFDSVLAQVSIAWIIVGLCTAALLQVVTAPFGRHTSSAWGFSVSNTVGWVTFEACSPLALWTAFLSVRGSFSVVDVPSVNAMLMCMWTLHYAHRAFVFPFQTVDDGKRMPVLVVVSAMLFNAVNGSLNGYFLGSVALEPSVLRLLGVVLFTAGAVMNIDHDYYLISLRANAPPSTYVIPQYRLFHLVSCANLAAELLEWTGFALAAYPSLPALSFAVWTFCNLVPRAVAHHRWYLTKFPNYPKNRRAVIPFLL